MPNQANTPIVKPLGVDKGDVTLIQINRNLFAEVRDKGDLVKDEQELYLY